jgi:hypothetical protein
MDIFLSYSQKDRLFASKVVSVLERRGWTVWWDTKGLHAGDDFRTEIERALHECRCVLVLWSEKSIRSPYVKDEAEDGRRRGVLVQAIAGKVEPPLGFRSYQYERLGHMSAPLSDEAMRRLVVAIARKVPVPAPPEPQPPRPPPLQPTPVIQPPQHPPLSSRVRAFWLLGAAAGIAGAIVALSGSSNVSPGGDPASATPPPASEPSLPPSAGASSNAAAPPASAEALLRTACEKDDAKSCAKLADAYLEGRDGLEKNVDKAIELYTNACDLKDGKQCTQLAERFAKGKDGLPTNQDRASALFEKGCDLGDSSACLEVGDRRRTGNGIEPDPVKAAIAYDRACKGLLQRGCKLQKKFYPPLEGRRIKEMLEDQLPNAFLRCHPGNPGMGYFNVTFDAAGAAISVEGTGAFKRDDKVLKCVLGVLQTMSSYGVTGSDRTSLVLELW